MRLPYAAESYPLADRGRATGLGRGMHEVRRPDTRNPARHCSGSFRNSSWARLLILVPLAIALLAGRALLAPTPVGADLREVDGAHEAAGAMAAA
jgi:hypothetical protein